MNSSESDWATFANAHEVLTTYCVLKSPTRYIATCAMTVNSAWLYSPMLLLIRAAPTATTASCRVPNLPDLPTLIECYSSGSNACAFFSSFLSYGCSRLVSVIARIVTTNVL